MRKYDLQLESHCCMALSVQLHDYMDSRKELCVCIAIQSYSHRNLIGDDCLHKWRGDEWNTEFNS